MNNIGYTELTVMITEHQTHIAIVIMLKNMLKFGLSQKHSSDSLHLPYPYTQSGVSPI